MLIRELVPSLCTGSDTQCIMQRSHRPILTDPQSCSLLGPRQTRASTRGFVHTHPESKSCAISRDILQQTRKLLFCTHTPNEHFQSDAPPGTGGCFANLTGRAWNSMGELCWLCPERRGGFKRGKKCHKSSLFKATVRDWEPFRHRGRI